MTPSQPPSPTHEFCDKFLGAAKMLFASSTLCHVDTNGSFAARFRDSSEFEAALQDTGKEVYRRYHAWLQFVVGGENLVKAWGLCTKNEARKWPKHKGALPLPPKDASKLSSWIRAVVNGKPADGTTVDDFGTLNDWLPLLTSSSNSDVRRAGANYLRECRNREAHHYIQGTRTSRYDAIPHLLIPFFNELLGDMLKRGHSSP